MTPATPVTPQDLSAVLLEALHDAPQVVQVFRPVHDADGRVIDFFWVYTNRCWNEKYGSKAGKRLLTENPGVVDAGIFARMVQVLETGVAQTCEQHYCHEQIDGWFEQTMVRAGDACVVVYSTDLTAPKTTIAQQAQHAHALEESRDLLQTILNTSPLGMVLVRSVRDAAGVVTDFEYLWVNQVAGHLAGAPIVGRRMLELYPHMKQIGLFKSFVAALDTDHIHEFEAYYDAQDAWVRWLFARHEDGLYIAVEDVSSRKRSEQQVLQHKTFVEAIAATTPDLITIHDACTNRVIYANHDNFWMDADQPHRMRELPGDERARAMVHPDDHQKAQQFIHDRALLADGTQLEVELHMSGSVEWVRIRSQVFRRDAAGRALEIFSISTDITARKRAELELQEDHYFLEQVTDNTPHLIYVYDVDEQRYIYINKRIEELTGRSPEYVYGMGMHLFRKVVHPDDLGARIDYFGRLSSLVPGEIRENEFRLAAGDGWRWFRSKDHVFRSEDGQTKQVIGLAEDITYEKMLRERAGRLGAAGLN